MDISLETVQALEPGGNRHEAELGVGHIQGKTTGFVRLGPGQDRSEPEFLEAVKRVKEAARRHDLRLGIHANTPEYAARMAQQGFDLVTVCSDAALVSAGAIDAVQRFRKL